MEVNKNESISSLFDSLDEWLNDENRIVTYRNVSVTFSLHVNYAKHVLEEFTKLERVKNRSLSVTYCLAGHSGSEENKAYKLVVVPEELKEETQASMLPPVSCHVYSIQNCKLKTADMLYMADFDLLKSSGLDANRFSAVKCPSARTTARTAATDVASVSSNIRTSQTASKSTLPASASTAANQTKSAEVKKSTEKASQSKSSAGFGRLFGNVAKKQPAGGDKKASSRSSEVGQSVSGSSGVSENVMLSKPKLETPSSIQTTTSETTSSKTASDSRKQVADVSKTAHKQSGPTKTKNESGKRRRIVSVSSSDDEDADMLEPSSPELIVPSPPASAAAEAEPMEVDTVPSAAGDNSTEPHRMQRKLVSKMYVNEEGYMVTEKLWQNEMVPVTADEDTTKKPVVQPSAPQPLPKKQPTKKTPPQNSRTKQSSLTNFFQKK